MGAMSFVNVTPFEDSPVWALAATGPVTATRKGTTAAIRSGTRYPKRWLTFMAHTLPRETRRRQAKTRLASTATGGSDIGRQRERPERAPGRGILRGLH